MTGERSRRRIGLAASARQWEEARDRFLAAVDPLQRVEVRGLVAGPAVGGIGLRCWLSALAWGGARLPARLPFKLVQVYLDNPGVAPLAECAGCGVSLPVGPGRRGAAFTACPACRAAQPPGPAAGGLPGHLGENGVGGEARYGAVMGDSPES